MTEEKTYYVLHWKQDMTHMGWPNFEVRPMPVDADKDFEVLAENLSFADANAKLKELEKKDGSKDTERA